MEKSFAARPFLAKELSMTSLRRRMTEDMQVRNLSSQTQATYVQQVSLFARHFNKSPEILGPEEIRSYQVCTPSHFRRVAGLKPLCIMLYAHRFPEMGFWRKSSATPEFCEGGRPLEGGGTAGRRMGDRDFVVIQLPQSLKPGISAPTPPGPMGPSLASRTCVPSCFAEQAPPN